MNQIVSFRLCKLSNEDLLKKVDELTDKIYIDGKIPTRHIPARPDEDYDLLVGELLKRFQELDTTLTTTTPPEGKGYSLQQVADTWDAANDYAKEREDYRYGKRGPFQYPNKETFIASLPPQPVKDDLKGI